VGNVGDWLREGVEILQMIPSALSGWELSIARFEAHDRVNPPPKGAIVFTGSSSITFWKTLERDMAPLPVVNRGFGGSKIGQVAGFVDRIVTPYAPRAVVLFAGTNDIAPPKPATPEAVLQGYLEFVKRVHAALPAIPIYFITITPTPSRWKLWPAVCAANDMITAFAANDPRLRIIDMTEQCLGADGLPDRGIYRVDKLHPNQKGYARWTEVIKPVLMAEVGAPVSSRAD